MMEGENQLCIISTVCDYSIGSHYSGISIAVTGIRGLNEGLRSFDED